MEQKRKLKIKNFLIDKEGRGILNKKAKD